MTPTDTLAALARCWLAGEDCAAALHDALEEAGVPYPDGLIRAIRQAVPERMCLAISYPGDHEAAWRGGCGPNRVLVRPGPFDGTEGGIGRSGERFTGWYTPDGWLTPAEAEAALTAAAWDSEFLTHDGLPRDGEASGGDVGVARRLYAASLLPEFLATPADFPGLGEHYPWAVAAWHEHRAAAAEAALRRALRGG